MKARGREEDIKFLPPIMAILGCVISDVSARLQIDLEMIAGLRVYISSIFHSGGKSFNSNQTDLFADNPNCN